MVWIQHYGRQDVKEGFHYWDDRTALIQIKDTDQEYVVPALKFVKTLQLEFEDTEDESDETGCKEHHAKSLVKFLRECFNEKLNVVVHCHAGICRSSAVAVFAQKLGFQLEDKIRLPNKLVLHKLLFVSGFDDESLKIEKNLKVL